MSQVDKLMAANTKRELAERVVKLSAALGLCPSCGGHVKMLFGHYKACTCPENVAKQQRQREMQLRYVKERP